MNKCKIESKVPEDVLIESLLNMKHSGVDEHHIMIVLSIHAMANEWHFDKLSYYLGVLEIEK